MSSRNVEIDVLKGIGIFSVVLGHALVQDDFPGVYTGMAHHFVYTYHMMLFVFLSGYLFRKTTISMYVYKKLKSLYLPAAVVVAVSLCLYPLWIWLGVLEKKDVFSDMASMVVRTLLLAPNGIFTGALWFVAFLFGTGLLSLVLIKIFGNHKKLLCIIVVLIGILGMCTITGLEINHVIFIKLVDIYSLTRILVAVPVFFLGIAAREKGLLQRINSWIWIPLAAVILIINQWSGQVIDIAAFQVYGKYGFYPMTILGLIFAISLGKALCHCKALTNLFSFFGKCSFWIMGFHNMVFKLVDGIAGKTNLVNTGAGGVLRLYPFSFPQLRIVYVVLGMGIPVAAVWLGKITEQWIKSYRHRRKSAKQKYEIQKKS